MIKVSYTDITGTNFPGLRFIKKAVRKAINILFVLLKYILPYGLVEFLKENKSNHTENIKIKLKNWPEKIPEKILFEGLPQNSSGYYDNFFLSRHGVVRAYMYGKEVLYGISLDQQVEHDISFVLEHGKVTLPLSLPGLQGVGKKTLKDLTITIDSEPIKLHRLECGRWKYFTLPDSCKAVKLFSKESKILLGEPMFHVKRLRNDSTRKPKCVVLLVIDSLSQFALDSFTKEALMPYTSQFFERGRYFANHYAQGEWTLPNMASIFSGLYTSNHGLYQPEIIFNYENDEAFLSAGLKNNTPLLSEIFKNDGYLTFGATASWRIHPLYKFARGYDRFLYYGNYTSDRDILFEALDQLNAFPNRNHFMYLHLLRPHSEIPPMWSFSSEVDSDILKRGVPPGRPKIRRKYDSSLSERYYAMVKETDKDLKVLYDTIKKRYNEDEVVFCLMGDHGVIYLDDDDHLLSDTHINVPLFVQSPKIKPGIDNFLVQNTDTFSSILSLCDIDLPLTANDGKLWPILGGIERDYILAESIYGSEYKLKLRDKKYIYNLKCSIENSNIDLENARKIFEEVSTGNKYEKHELDNNEFFEKFDIIAKRHLNLLLEKVCRKNISV